MKAKKRKWKIQVQTAHARPRWVDLDGYSDTLEDIIRRWHVLSPFRKVFQYRILNEKTGEIIPTDILIAVD